MSEIGSLLYIICFGILLLVGCQPVVTGRLWHSLSCFGYKKILHYPCMMPSLAVWRIWVFHHLWYRLSIVLLIGRNRLVYSWHRRYRVHIPTQKNLGIYGGVISRFSRSWLCALIHIVWCRLRDVLGLSGAGKLATCPSAKLHFTLVNGPNAVAGWPQDLSISF